jgi:hypothetical protein
MSQVLVTPNLAPVEGFLAAPCMAQVSSQHLECSNCSSDGVSLNSPTFVFTTAEGTSVFTLPPMSGSEIGALALFFNTASKYFGQINFDHIPGFRVTSKSQSSSAVTFTFQADPELLSFMGIEGTANLTHATLNSNQIFQLADDLIEVSANCK